MINLAVMRYSHSCWITDYVGTDPDICAGIRGGANELFPAVHNHQSFYFPKECEDAKAEFPTAAVLAHFAGVLGVGQWLCRVSECHLDEFARLVRRYGEVRDYLKGDYYRLIRAVDRRGWEAWQFHDPERGAGILIVLRLSENTQSGIHFSLRGFFASLPPQVRVIEGTAHVSVEKSDVTLDLKTSRACLLHYTS